MKSQCFTPEGGNDHRWILSHLSFLVLAWLLGHCTDSIVISCSPTFSLDWVCYCDSWLFLRGICYALHPHHSYNYLWCLRSTFEPKPPILMPFFLSSSPLMKLCMYVAVILWHWVYCVSTGDVWYYHCSRNRVPPSSSMRQGPCSTPCCLQNVFICSHCSDVLKSTAHHKFKRKGSDR